MNETLNEYRLIRDKICLNGEMHHRALKFEWYIERNIQEIYTKIFEITEFLNDYQPSLRERIYHIQQDIVDLTLCQECNKNKLVFCSGSKGFFRKTCSDETCKHSLRVKNRHLVESKMTDEQKLIRAERSSRINKGRKYTEEQCLQMSLRQKGRKPSKESRIKTIETRRNNGRPWHTEESKKKISETNKETHNSPEFKSKRTEIYTTEVYQKQSETMKQKIASGEFTPCITNSWTRWDAKVELEDGTIKKFRSSWEACFWFCNQHLEYEKIRIPYSIDGTWKNYIVDFVDTEQRILYEIKPNSVKDNESNILKSEAAKEWCRVNNYSYSMITDEWFIENVKDVDFKNNIGILEKMRQFLVK